jgi:hypothetical protein
MTPMGASQNEINVKPPPPARFRRRPGRRRYNFIQSAAIFARSF